MEDTMHEEMMWVLCDNNNNKLRAKVSITRMSIQCLFLYSFVPRKLAKCAGLRVDMKFKHYVPFDTIIILRD